jgi:hypothetical protein
MSEIDRFAPCNSTDPIEHFWTAVLRGWDIEPRAYFEKEAVPMGFKSPIEMAVHWMWKRHAKDWPNEELATQRENVQHLLDTCVPVEELLCDCGAVMTCCTGCAVSEYQAANPNCSTCCPIQPAANDKE